MDDQLFQQINHHIDEHYGHLHQRLEDLAASVHALHTVLVARLDAHDEYHRQYEHRWGLIKLAGRHPFRLAAAAVAAAWLLAAAAPGSIQLLATLARRLLHLLAD